MVYQWRFNMGVPAEKAGKELEKIERKHGSVTPQLVLEASRSEKATLHKCFEWDDTKAAEKYRLSQAGMIIQNLLVIVEESPSREPVRAFVNTVTKAPAQKGSFVHVTSALQDEELKRSVLANALAELKEFQKKYQDLTELADVLKAIEKLTA